MPHQRTPLIARLRSLRRLWFVAMIALVFKLATVTACMTDGIAPTESAPDVVSAVDAAHASGDACALGESGECHCACAHSVAFAAADTACCTDSFIAQSYQPRIAVHFLPAPADSPLRPPIA